jgi:hypothetical protein
MLTVVRTILFALILAAAPLPAAAAAGDLEQFVAALEQAQLQYQIALRTLEKSGREQTAAEVRLFRQAWQQVIDRLDKNRPEQFGTDESYAAIMTEIDARVVGALIVIDIGSRDAARSALAPIGDTLARLRERAAPTEQSDGDQTREPK